MTENTRPQDAQTERVISEAAIVAAAESIEDDAMRWLGRDLGTAHRDDIARNALVAALPHLTPRDEAAVKAEALAQAWEEGVQSCDSDHMAYHAHKVGDSYATTPNPYRADGLTEGASCRSRHGVYDEHVHDQDHDRCIRCRASS